MDGNECSCIACPNKNTADRGTNLLQCSKCKSLWFCSKECQKKAWAKEGHKYCCEGPDVARHVVKDFTVRAIQDAIDTADSGDIIVLEEGTYEASRDDAEKDEALGSKLHVRKGIKICGPPGGMDAVKINCHLWIDDADSGKDLVVLANLEISGLVHILNNSFDTITFCHVRVKLNKSTGEAMEINHIRGKLCLLLDCEIFGGEDALFINGTEGFRPTNPDIFSNKNKVHIKRTKVGFSKNRGIYANDSFIIENSVVGKCGSYGIKSNHGWTEKGRSVIQPGPQGPEGGRNPFFGAPF